MPLPSLKALVTTRKKPSQARAQRTLDTLFEATAQVLMQQGEAGFTTNRVAERSGFSIGTLYQYFPNKQSLLLGLIEHERRRSMAERQRFLTQAKERGLRVREVLRDYIHASIDEFGSCSVPKRMLVQLAWRNDDQAAFARALDDMAAFLLELLTSLDDPELRAPSEAQVYVLTRAVMGAIRSASLEASPLLDSAEFKDEMVRLAWGMLRREPG